jgi:murein DD-endopeptidase MepM/ murein hydrolase activator NlpD
MARHFGLDLSTTTGKAVTAVKPGRVVAAGKWLHLGNTVVVEHAAREYSVYAYLGTLSVAEGAAVAAGTPLGTAGFSGDAESVHRTNATSAPRLHFALISGRRTGLAGVGQPLRLFSTSADAWLPDMDSVATPVNPVTRLPSRCFRSSKP